MLSITVPGVEMFDEVGQSFTTHGDVVLELEHSLVSLSKWEQKFQKPFLGKEAKSTEEIISYIKSMVLTPNVPEEVFDKLTQDNITAINAYIEAKMSATSFPMRPLEPRSQEVITSELIYYWMTVFQIPFECQHWHLNRLFTFIQVCNFKQSKPKKMGRNEIAARNRELNAQRRAQLGTKG